MSLHFREFGASFVSLFLHKQILAHPCRFCWVDGGGRGISKKYTQFRANSGYLEQIYFFPKKLAIPLYFHAGGIWGGGTVCQHVVVFPKKQTCFIWHQFCRHIA